MTSSPRICVVVPVYNHALTVGEVVGGARAWAPVIAVNDGSTDETAARLSAEREITVVALKQNSGKATALITGFAKATQLGFTHAITLDADGQHPTGALPDFLNACRRQPEAFIIGVRDLVKEGAPAERRLSNRLSTFWFHVETGVPLTDTQCGYRCYPLEAISRLRTRASRYAFELEVMVLAAWAGIPLLPLPVATDYRAPTSRLSHFRPGRDFLHISWLHLRLTLQALRSSPERRRRLARGGQG